MLLRDKECNLGWHVIHTKPRQEEVALRNLQQQGYVCYLPYIKIEKIRRRKAEIVSEAMFPRYLFIQLDCSNTGKSWIPIRSTLGVSKLVQFGQQAARVDAELIRCLQAAESEQLPQKLFQPGDKVRVTTGAFAGLEAIYTAESAEHRSIILLEILSKKVQLPIETRFLEEVD